MDGQTETDINKIKQMVDKHLHMKIHVVIDFFLLHSLYPPLHSPRQYLLIHVTVGLCSEQNILFYIASILEYLSFFSLIGYVSAFHSSMLCSLAFEAMVHSKAIPPRVNG